MPEWIPDRIDGMSKKIKNVWRAELREICGGRCRLEYIKIVEERTADNETLADALEHVLRAVCPPPAQRISLWFYETKAGQKIAWAMWKLWGHEAITLSQACRLFWGDASPRYLGRLNRLVKLNKIKIYFDPTVLVERKRANGALPKRAQKSGRIWRSSYVRHSDVMKLIELDDYNPPRLRDGPNAYMQATGPRKPDEEPRHLRGRKPKQKAENTNGDNAG